MPIFQEDLQKLLMLKVAGLFSSGIEAFGECI